MAKYFDAADKLRPASIKSCRSFLIIDLLGLKSLFLIPFISIYQYFVLSYENLYFLALGLIQLSTGSYIALLPSHWSPTGPYNTIIPLLCCFLIELFINYINWIFQKKYELDENYNIISVFGNRNNSKYSKDIYPGDIIIIKKNSIIPVDCIALQCPDSNNPNISLSTLNGETDLVPVKSIINNKDTIDKYLGQKFSVINFHANDLSNIECKIGGRMINEKYFLPGGAINKDNCFVALVIACGKNKKCYKSF